MCFWSSGSLVLVAQNAPALGVTDLGHFRDEFLPVALVSRSLDIALVDVARGGLVVLLIGLIAGVFVHLIDGQVVNKFLRGLE